MVTYVRDPTGRFPQRPFYKPEELDRECESIITKFMKELHGALRYPIETEDLKTLIERDVEDLDVYADLSAYGAEVEGVTEFKPGRKPSVKIASHLTEDERRENRLRTTLTHEYGHVRFHSYLFDIQLEQGNLFQQRPDGNRIICKRDSMIDAVKTDWMEWQAGYACGAFLMPKTAVTEACRSYVEKCRLAGTVSLQTAHGTALLASITQAFHVSMDAARVRLIKLGLVSEGPSNRTLFG